MSEFIADNCKLREINSDKCELVIQISKYSAADFERYFPNILSGKNPLLCNIKEAVPVKSQSANAFLWYLCEEIAREIRSTKEEVYRDVIRNAGKFEVLSVPKFMWEKEVEKWKSNGIGWQVDIISEDEEYIEAIFYPGTSTYNKTEMNRLLNYVTDEADNLDIKINY